MEAVLRAYIGEIDSGNRHSLPYANVVQSAVGTSGKSPRRDILMVRAKILRELHASAKPADLEWIQLN